MFNRPDRLLIILFNLIPIIGVAYYDWAPFQMFWLFWMETLIISVFNTVRVLYSQGLETGERAEQHRTDLNVGSAFKFLLIRIFVFLFYSLFIIVFIGVMSSNSKKGVEALSVIFFGNSLFNLALAITVASQSFYLIKYFFLNGAYLFSKPNQYPAIFDARQIVIHVAVVLGGVGTAFLFKDGAAKWGEIWIIAIFCVIKCIFELFFATHPADANINGALKEGSAI
ncbi:MAG: hypothetical protein EOO06_10915 [Chitinophagaceae bacterium]|nr:MAG: hypothetical protein EOO06_10915 [Chitinophagaceae bacterium]